VDEEQTQADGGVHERDAAQDITDFDVLRVDMTPAEPSRRAPNPLRAARPDLLARYRDSVDSVMAARRAGIESPDR
jgi:hypothetical protein